MQNKEERTQNMRVKSVRPHSNTCICHTHHKDRRKVRLFCIYTFNDDMICDSLYKRLYGMQIIVDYFVACLPTHNGRETTDISLREWVSL